VSGCKIELKTDLRCDNELMVSMNIEINQKHYKVLISSMSATAGEIAFRLQISKIFGMIVRLNSERCRWTKPLLALGLNLFSDLPAPVSATGGPTLGDKLKLLPVGCYENGTSLRQAMAMFFATAYTLSRLAY
jgi:hypothetical protein